MRAIRYSAPLQFDLVDLPEPALRPGEVRLGVLRVGVCGTDLHLHRGHFGARFPHTPGHEIVGEVVEVAAGVELPLGARVVVEDGVYCGRCAACRAGRFVACASIRALGVSLPGGAAERLVVPEGKCTPVDGMDPDLAVLAEPLSCVLHAMDRLDLEPGARVLVLGTGTAGQLLAVLARRSGAAHVTVASSSVAKLELATRLGADRAVVVDRAPGAALTVLRDAAPDGFDAVIDATGAPAMLEAGLELCAFGGTLMIYGVAEESVRLEVSPYRLFRRELRVIASYAQVLTLPRAVRYLAGSPELAALVTHRFALADYADALAALGSPDCVKAVVMPGV